MRSTESYLVRIYHRSPSQPQQLIGMLEDMTVNDVWTFESEQELIEILRRLETKATCSRFSTAENESARTLIPQANDVDHK